VGWSRGAVRCAVAAQATVLPAVSLQAGRPIRIALLAPVKRVAIAMRVVTPLVEQHQPPVTPLKLAPGLQLGHATADRTPLVVPPVLPAPPSFRAALAAIVVWVSIQALVQAVAPRAPAERGAGQDTAAARSAHRVITSPTLGKAAVLPLVSGGTFQEMLTAARVNAPAELGAVPHTVAARNAPRAITSPMLHPADASPQALDTTWADPSGAVRLNAAAAHTTVVLATAAAVVAGRAPTIPIMEVEVEVAPVLLLLPDIMRRRQADVVRI
jgi:hypothetical protein